MQKGAKNLEFALYKLVDSQPPINLMLKLMKEFPGETLLPKKDSEQKKLSIQLKFNNSLQFLFEKGVSINFNNNYSVFRSSQLGCFNSLIPLFYFGSSLKSPSKQLRLVEWAEDRSNFIFN